MIEDIAKGLELALNKVDSVTPATWIAIGFTVASIPATYTLIEWYKKRRIKKELQALSGHVTVILVAIASFLFSIVDFVVTNGTSLNALATFLPFWVAHGSTIMAGAITLREFLKALKEKRLRDAAETLKLQVQPQAVTPPTGAASLAPLPQPAPNPNDLFA